MQRFSTANKHIFNLIGSSKNIQEAIYDITFHLYSDDIKYEISKKKIEGLTVRFSENNYKELKDTYSKNLEKPSNVVINNCNHISCQEINDLYSYIRVFSNNANVHNIFVFSNKNNYIDNNCPNIRCKCINKPFLNMTAYYTSNKFKFNYTKSFIQNILSKPSINGYDNLFLPLPKKITLLPPDI
jgi:hypothetical protein